MEKSTKENQGRVRRPNSSVSMFRTSIASCRKAAWIMRLHETCKVRNFSCLSRAMSVSRVFLGFAMLSWTSWIAADLFISGFPGSRTSRLCREHVRRLSCRRRMFVPGYKSADSINNRPIRAESPATNKMCRWIHEQLWQSQQADSTHVH